MMSYVTLLSVHRSFLLLKLAGICDHQSSSSMDINYMCPSWQIGRGMQRGLQAEYDGNGSLFVHQFWIPGFELCDLAFQLIKEYLTENREKGMKGELLALCGIVFI